MPEQPQHHGNLTPVVRAVVDEVPHDFFESAVKCGAIKGAVVNPRIGCGARNQFIPVVQYRFPSRTQVGQFGVIGRIGAVKSLILNSVIPSVVGHETVNKGVSDAGETIDQVFGVLNRSQGFTALPNAFGGPFVIRESIVQSHGLEYNA